MPKNHGRLPHFLGWNALEALNYEYWNMDLVDQVEEELQQAVHLLTSLERVPDYSWEDLRFYQSLLEMTRHARKENTLSPLPLVQEDLEQYFKEKSVSHREIRNGVGGMEAG
ncbi:hypothetical protein JOD24_001894 [Kroppenstedtia sanguinis]|uniref:Uncharacterized protein n=1 Tax=Kroppenstedtia sanguinis TaxID=1380684 RepID=A0ABW4C997_9BACL